MKKTQTLKFCGLALAALLLGSANSVFAQTTNIVINNFASGNEGTTPSGCGTEWGDGTIYWDNSQLFPGTTGSGYIDAGFTNASVDGSDYPVNEQICYPGDNWYYYNPNGQAGVDLSQYSAIQIQVLWDNADSSINIDQFNNPSTIPGASFATYSTAGLQVGWIYAELATNYTYVTNGAIITTNETVTPQAGGYESYIGDVNIPDAASNGWTTMTIPIPDNLNGTANTYGIVLQKWIGNESSSPVPAPTAFFWIGNVQLLGTATPPPPPTLQFPVKTAPGLNVIATTEGNTFFDRQEVGLVASNGVSWVGNDLTSPVTYSFTVSGFPQGAATEGGYSSSTVTNTGGCEAYMMMAPNPAAYDNAIDWNEPDCVVVQLQQETNGQTLMEFQFKTNEPSGGSQYTPNTIGTLAYNGSALGKWSVTFSSDTNVTMTAPDGSSTNFVFSPAAVAYFAETSHPGMYLYLGMQANNAGALNQAVCYSNFSITGAPAAMSDNFTTDPTLNTNLWFNFMASGPSGVFVMPPGAEDWITWTLPDAGFQLQAATKLLGPWQTLTDDRIVGEIGQVSQIVTTNDIPAGTPDAFFELAKP